MWMMKRRTYAPNCGGALMMALPLVLVAGRHRICIVFMIDWRPAHFHGEQGVIIVCGGAPVALLRLLMGTAGHCLPIGRVGRV